MVCGANGDDAVTEFAVISLWIYSSPILKLYFFFFFFNFPLDEEKKERD